MSIARVSCIPCLMASLLIAPGAFAFDDSSLTGCYVVSASGQLLGPKVTIDDAGQLAADPQDLVSHGFGYLARVCFDGEGAVPESQAVQNIAGVCEVPFTATGTYGVDATTGIGDATVSATIPEDASLPPGCGLLGVQPGATSSFEFAFLLDGEGCFRVLTLTATTGDTPVPMVAVGEGCPQVLDTAETP